MAEENRLRRFAVLIDADNTSPRIAAGLFEEVAKFGEASVRRIYGDFSEPALEIVDRDPAEVSRSIRTSNSPTRLERTHPTSPW